MSETLTADPAEENTPTATPTRSLCETARNGRIVLMVNPMSGSVGPKAAGEAETILREFDCDATVIAFEPGRIDAQIDEVFADPPKVLLVLAGDGTARAVASRAQADGPLVCPLPGGTMNMLPKALYGTADWRAALRSALEEGEPQFVSGGEVEGERFYCAAILGSAALWAPAREAVREGRLKLAWAHARRAWRRAFTGRLRYALDNGRRAKTEALVLISPMISKAMDEPVGLEAAAMDPSDTGQAFRLAATALFSDWRRDPSVRTQPARRILVESRSRIPAVIDGEPTLLPPSATVVFRPKAFRALAPRPPAAEDTV